MPGPIPGVAAHLKILIVTDAWRPQVNGVVRTLEVRGDDLAALGHAVRYATPEGRFTVGLPTYPEIRLAVWPRTRLEKEIRDFAPDAVHIATEGTLEAYGPPPPVACPTVGWAGTMGAPESPLIDAPLLRAAPPSLCTSRR